MVRYLDIRNLYLINALHTVMFIIHVQLIFSSTAYFVAGIFDFSKYKYVNVPFWHIFVMKYKEVLRMMMRISYFFELEKS